MAFSSTIVVPSKLDRFTVDTHGFEYRHEKKRGEPYDQAALDVVLKQNAIRLLGLEEGGTGATSEPSSSTA